MQLTLWIMRLSLILAGVFFFRSLINSFSNDSFKKLLGMKLMITGLVILYIPIIILAFSENLNSYTYKNISMALIINSLAILQFGWLYCRKFNEEFKH